jgi:hypothetical protein
LGGIWLCRVPLRYGCNAAEFKKKYLIAIKRKTAAWHNQAAVLCYRVEMFLKEVLELLFGEKGVHQLRDGAPFFAELADESYCYI